MPELSVRREVAWFAQCVEGRLRLNDHKGGWQDVDPLWLLAKLTEEVGELANTLAMHPKLDTRGAAWHAIMEAADAAAVAMMIADQANRRLMGKEERPVPRMCGGCPVWSWAIPTEHTAQSRFSPCDGYVRARCPGDACDRDPIALGYEASRLRAIADALDRAALQGLADALDRVAEKRKSEEAAGRGDAV